MKNATRLICLVACIAVLAVLFVLPMSAESAAETVTVRIEGITDCIFYEEVEIDDTIKTVQDLLAKVDAENDYVTIYGVSSGYITQVNDDGSGLTTIGWDGWMYRVNGVAPMVGVSGQAVKGGDEVILYYTDEYVTGMQYPEMDISHLNSLGVIAFYSKDADWYGNVTENPVAGMTVLIGSEEYTTDENGEIMLSDAIRSAGGEFNVYVYRYDDVEGIPTVLRFAPDVMINVMSVYNPLTGDMVVVYAALAAIAALTVSGATLFVCRKAHN